MAAGRGQGKEEARVTSGAPRWAVVAQPEMGPQGQGSQLSPSSGCEEGLGHQCTVGVG